MFVAATNLNTGEVEYFNEGGLIEIVLASSSIPVLFKPQKINNTLYVDGGLTNNLPIEPIEQKCK